MGFLKGAGVVLLWIFGLAALAFGALIYWDWSQDHPDDWKWVVGSLAYVALFYRLDHLDKQVTDLKSQLTFALRDRR